MKKRNKKCIIVLFILSIIAVLMVIYKILVDQMPECRITKLYVDDHSPLIQTYEKKGEEALLLQMDFYIVDTSEAGPLMPYQQYEGYTWAFTRKDAHNKWSLISWGYF